jgi:CRISPR system Cascade subunit CasD
MSTNTLFLRLEGPLQSWGTQESKFVIRRTAGAPTKSGVIGLICAALGIPRTEVSVELPLLNSLRMGVRIDLPGVRWWDYHTVGARMEMRTAEGKSKPGAMLTRREYLCDASFLVVLQGDPALINRLAEALTNPIWTLYLGRKCCPPSRPVLEYAPGEFPGLLEALVSIPWRRRYKEDLVPTHIESLVEWQPTPLQPEAPEKAEVWYDVPLTFEPPSHAPRFVIRGGFTVGPDGQIIVDEKPMQSDTPAPLRLRANYTNSQYLKKRSERLEYDNQLCVFCKVPATTVQHITYRHAGGNETLEELRSLCRLCHDAVTMLEYGMGMTVDRINPEDSQWRELITQKRAEIIRFRSIETRRRRLEPEEVE